MNLNNVKHLQDLWIELVFFMPQGFAMKEHKNAFDNWLKNMKTWGGMHVYALPQAISVVTHISAEGLKLIAFVPTCLIQRWARVSSGQNDGLKHDTELQTMINENQGNV